MTGSACFPAFAFAALLAATAAAAQERPRRVVFEPAIGAEQVFKVEYRPRLGAASETSTGIRFRLSMTPVARLPVGYRVRVLVSDLERFGPDLGYMNMVIGAALITDGEPFELRMNERGGTVAVEDFWRVRLRLLRRAVALPTAGGVRGIARSVVDNHDDKQLADRIVPAIQRMGFAHSYLRAAQESSSNVVSWFGFPFDMALAPDAATGGVVLTWKGQNRDVTPEDIEGRAVFRPDGWIVHLTARGVRQEVTTIEAVPTVPQ